jgi:hypothetical protein
LIVLPYHITVRNSASSLTDWFVISVRWLTVLGLTVSLSLHGRLVSLPGMLLFALAVWNIAMTEMAGMLRLQRCHRWMSLFLDLVVALSLFWQQGGFGGPAYWAGFLPMFTAAFYFYLGSTFIVAVLVSLAEIGLAWLLKPSLPTLMEAGIAAAVLLIPPLLLGSLGGRLEKGAPPVQPEKPEKIEKDMVNLRERTELVNGLLNI